MAKEAKFELGEVRPEFGAALRSAFALDFADVFINQGSYGTAPKCVLEYRQSLLRAMESSPDRWMRSKVYPHYKRAQARISEFVGCSPANLVFVSNTTTGINCVIKSLQLEPNDVILVTNLIYPALMKLMRQVAEWRGAEIRAVHIELPIRNEEQIVELIEKACREDPRVRVVMTDHVGWNTGMVFPVQSIRQILRTVNEQIMYVVDGAHAAGQLELELDHLDVDFYVSNLHKWAFAPRSCAILWANPKHHDIIMPLVTSINWERDWQLRFFYQGTSDQTMYISTEGSLLFMEALGGVRAMQQYVSPMLTWAQKMFAEELGTTCLPIPKNMEAPYIRLVALPGEYKGRTDGDADAFLKRILEETNVSLMIRLLDDKFWVRLSGGVYNTKDDYVKALDVLKKYV